MNTKVVVTVRKEDVYKRMPEEPMGRKEKRRLEIR